MFRVPLSVAICWCFLLLSGCDSLMKNKEDSTTDSLRIGQFSLVQVELRDAKGGRIPALFKLNTITGDTWMLNGRDTLVWSFIGEDKDPLGLFRDGHIPTDEEIDTMSLEELKHYLNRK